MAQQPVKKAPRLSGADSAPPRLSGADSAPFTPAQHAKMLGITEEMPPRPEKPTPTDILSGAAPLLHKWVPDLWKYVVWRLSERLYNDPLVSLRKPLRTQRTPPFVAEGVAPTTYKEPWNMQNCLSSLRSNGFYEGSLTAWQFAPATTEWNSMELGIETVSWQQLGACEGLWSPTQLANSAAIHQQERFIFPGFVPTCVESDVVIEELMKKEAFFNDLPACGGNAVLWSLIVALSDAVDANKPTRVMQLYQASVTVTARMRLAPQKMQIILDQLSFTDVIRVQGKAIGATSFLEFLILVLRMPEITGLESGPELETKLSTMGVMWQGQDVGKQLCYAILSAVGVATKGIGLAAVRFLERVEPSVFAEPTKLMRTFQVLKKACGREEWLDAAANMMESIAVAILSGDCNAEEFTGDYLVPKARRAIGYVQSSITKTKFLKWFLDEQMTLAAGGARSGAISPAGLLAMKDKCFSPRAFWFEFRDAEWEDLVVHDALGSLCRSCLCMGVILWWILGGFGVDLEWILGGSWVYLGWILSRSGVDLGWILGGS